MFLCYSFNNWVMLSFPAAAKHLFIQFSSHAWVKFLEKNLKVKGQQQISWSHVKMQKQHTNVGYLNAPSWVPLNFLYICFHWGPVSRNTVCYLFFCADDIQIYSSLRSSWPQCMENLWNCLKDVKTWSESNVLCLNDTV